MSAKKKTTTPFEVSSIEELAGADSSRMFRVRWKTIADDGLPEDAEALLTIGTDHDPETAISEFLLERRAARDRHNERKTTEPAPVELDREPRAELLDKIGPKVNR